MAPTQTVQIAALAAGFKLNPKTIRYYEGIGLLPAARRTTAGYRLYTDRERDRLRFITKAKAVGLTLAEITEVLILRDGGDQPCDQVVEILDQKLAAVDRQLERLVDFRRELATVREEAAESRGAEACVCGIIERHEAPRREPLLLRPPL
jgi:DNA-binding transcriptional MerR regulator